MLKLIISLLPLLVYLVSSASQPQVQKINYQGKDYIAVPQTAVNKTISSSCNADSCNGLLYKVIFEGDGDDVSIGECRVNIPGGNQLFCFVNEDTDCPKEENENFPGQYISTLPCEFQPDSRGDCNNCKHDCNCNDESCLLGGTQILMADHSTKSIENIKPGEFILDGHLKPVQVIEVFKNFLGNNQLHQFYPHGPVFTKSHQFLSNLEQGQVGVMDKETLLTESPQMEESTIHNLKEMESLLQFKDGNVVQSGFDVVSYKPMDRSTPIYFIITNGQDGTYIADNFVSRDVMPDFEKWPLTYGTIGHILASCEINFPLDTVDAAQQLGWEIKDLTENWRLAISNIDDLEEANDFKFDHLAWIQLGNEAVMQNKEQMTFGQKLDKFGAKLLHEVLDDNNLPLPKRHALIKKIRNITMQSFTCNFVDLP